MSTITYTVRYAKNGRAWRQGRYAQRADAQLNATLRTDADPWLTATVEPYEDRTAGPVDPQRLYQWLARMAEDADREATQNECSANLDASLGQAYAAEAYREVMARMRRIDPSLAG